MLVFGKHERESILFFETGFLSVWKIVRTQQHMLVFRLRLFDGVGVNGLVGRWAGRGIYTHTHTHL